MAFSFSRLRTFDAYVKPMDGVCRKTTAGGFITIFSSLLTGYLFLSILSAYLSISTTQELHVDTMVGKGFISLSVDINFPKVQCEHLGVDVEDNNGR